MANPYIWAGLERANNDPTTIDEAIGEAIVAHNDDPDAHLGPTQALESHRASEIIDHRAESVVNDKLAILTRRYNAIVDPTDPSSFDTIEQAITYCNANRYGDIYVAEGTHYISSSIVIDPRISLYGAGIDETIILPNVSGAVDLNFNLVDDGEWVANYRMNIENLTLGSATNRFTTYEIDMPVNISFTNVAFAGWTSEFYLGEQYSPIRIIFTACRFIYDATTPSMTVNSGVFRDCIFTASTNSINGINTSDNLFENCQFNTSGSATAPLWFDSYSYMTTIRNCLFNGVGNTFACGSIATEYGRLVMESNDIIMGSTARLDINTNNAIFVNNYVKHTAANTVRIVTGTLRCIVANNVTTAAITNSGTGTGITNNVLI